MAPVLTVGKSGQGPIKVAEKVEKAQQVAKGSTLCGVGEWV